jgi:RND superfamily putative drug exporter
MVLVPATMEILGKANWWFPAWLERRLPKITIE